jgi:hypothetical protein
MPRTAIMVARGMIRLGLRDSSPYMAVDSNPTQDQNAKNNPMPAEPATARVPAPLGSATVASRFRKALRGFSEPSDQPSGPPPVTRTVTAMSASMKISVIRKTPRTFAVRLTSK